MLRWDSCGGKAWGVLLVLAGASALPVSVRGEVITLKSGFQLQGRLTRVSSLNQNPLQPAKGAGNVDVSKIVLVDDNLRRTFVSTNQVRTDGIAADANLVEARIPIPKRVAKGTRRIGLIGPIMDVTPFDEFGNRMFSMQGPTGRIDVIQGITLITPHYTRVEGLAVKNAYEWDMRVSTASIPRETLSQVLLQHIDQTDSNARLRVVTMYIQAQRYQDALVELGRVLQDFPDLKDLEKERARLYQLVAEDVIREIELRAAAGQHRQALELLKNFPEKDVASVLLIKVGEVLTEYERREQRRQAALQLLETIVAALSEDRAAARISAVAEEIRSELSLNNLDRLSDYLRLSDDDELSAEQKIAMAITGWLLGGGAARLNLAESLSLVEVREVVLAYLRSDNEIERSELLERLRSLEGGTPANLARIVAVMRPPWPTQWPSEGIPDMLEMTIRGRGDGAEFRYFVQLPPEYDPDRRYPCVVTLHGAGTSPEEQIDWWAGSYDPNRRLRLGQATRRGYIVVAPAWGAANQTKYGYSQREHAAVLLALRDAQRRFSIDSDRVFLSGHSMGGDAAWDIGLAHPDLWAGVLPVAATADQYIKRYWKNAKGLPLYFVAGQLDGNRLASNAPEIDRYMRYAGFDAMYVEYQGRGHEHFQEEILRMFEWMELNRRDFHRKEWECVAMRPWDQFFWWVELGDYPDRFVVLPSQWPRPKTREAVTEARITDNNTIRVTTPATSVTIWLSPSLVDFSRPITWGRDRVDVTPSNEVLLEDVRTRADRQHPFWAKFSPDAGRR